MLVRTAALVLLAANAVYFGWSQGLLAGAGLGPDTGREPQRMGQQIRPEALSVAQTAAPQPPPTPEVAPTAASSPAGATSAAAAPAVATSAAATQCLQAGPFDMAQAATLRQALALANLPDGTWALSSTPAPGRWIVYMGRYADAEALEKKRAELRALRVDTAPIGQPALSPGLSLGVFSTPAGAQEHLAQLARRGVRTARVVPEQPDNVVTQLRLPAADDAVRARVQALAVKPLNPC